MDIDVTWSSAQMPAHPIAKDPRIVDHLDPQAEDHQEDRPDEDHPVDPHTEGQQIGYPLEDHQEVTLEEPPGSGILEDIWRWIVYLKRRIWDLEQEMTINKIEIGKSATIAAKAENKLDMAKFEAGKLSSVVTKLQRRVDRLEDLRRDRSIRLPPLESGSNDSWLPRPDPDRSGCPTEAPGTDHTPSTCGSAQRSDPLPPRRSGEEERDKWLSAEYRRRPDPLRTPVQPMQLRHTPKPAPPAYGRYGPLQDEVPEEETEWDLEGPDGDPMEDFGISPAR